MSEKTSRTMEDMPIGLMAEAEAMIKEDHVNHPAHYCHGIECIDEMVMVFGPEKTATWCLLNVWKYRKRAPYKGGQEDMDKADFYMAKYQELMGFDPKIARREPPASDEANYGLSF